MNITVFMSWSVPQTVLSLISTQRGLLSDAWGDHSLVVLWGEDVDLISVGDI